MNTVEENALGFTINFNSSPQLAKMLETPTPIPPSTPKLTKSSGSMGSGSMSRWRKPDSRTGSVPKTPTSATATEEEEFSPITTLIPTDSLLDAEFLDQVSFSKRGSLMLSGKKAINGKSRPIGGRR